MKNIIKKIFILLGSLLVLTSCGQTQNNSEKNIDKAESRQNLTEQLGLSVHENTEALSVFTAANRNSFTKAITFKHDGKTVTINPPIFTGIPVGTNGYSENFKFKDGIVEIEVSVVNASNEIEFRYVYFNKQGDITDIRTSDDQIPNYGGENAPEIREELNLDVEVDGRIIGHGVMVMSSENGITLYDFSNKKLSDEFDAISYFYNGIALVQKDNKIGFIDEQGKTLLEPVIEFDEVLFLPKNKGMNPPYTDEDAFVIPIDGEYAIITMTREQ